MAETLVGEIDINDAGAIENTTITLNGDNADISAGGNGHDGLISVRDAAGNERVQIDGQTGDVLIISATGDSIFQIDGGEGDLTVWRMIGGVQQTVLQFDASNAILTVGGQGNEGDIRVRDSAGRTVFNVDSGSAGLTIGASGNEGDLRIRDGAGRTVLNFNGDTAALYIGTEGNEGDLIVRDGQGRNVMHFDSNYAALYIGADGNEGDLIVRDSAGRNVMHFDSNAAALYIGANGNEGDLRIRDGAGRDVLSFDAQFAVLDVGAAGNEGDIRVRNNAGDTTIHLDGNSGDIQLIGADCAEEFDVIDSETVAPGTVLVIDNDSKLAPCEQSYDKKVAGIVSGADGYKPGIVLDKNPSDNKRMPIALNGKAYCKVDAKYGAIEVGDLLTTSPTLGHAMKVVDPMSAFGTVIGKALKAHVEGTGLIPVLVALQ